MNKQFWNQHAFIEMFKRTFDNGLTLKPRNQEIREIENLQLVDWY